MFARILLILNVAVAVVFVGCGGVEDRRTSQLGTIGADDLRSQRLVGFSPLVYALDPSAADPKILVPVNRTLLSYQYDAIVEPDLTEDKTAYASIVTGIGLSAVDTVGNTLGFSLGIEAREYDSKTGSFSSNTKIFAAQGEDISGAQKFLILNSNSPNYLFSGLGLRLRYGKITSLQIQKKSMGDLPYDGASISGSKKIILPNGWAAVGIHIKFKPTIPVGVDPATIKIPFVQDAIFYISQLQKL
jgi:hypothetical protein